MGSNPGTINLEAWWSEDVDGTDSHGANNLTEEAAPSHVAGKVGNAVDFELDTSQYQYIADNASLSFGDEDFSVGGWFNLESKPVGAGMMGKWDFSTNDREYLLFYDASDRFSFSVSNNGTAFTAVLANTFGAPSLATYYFVIAIHDSVNNLLKISVNAGTQDTEAYTLGCNDNTSRFEIGALEGAVFFDGLADENFVYRKALSADEISWLYNGGVGRAYRELISGSNIFYM